jgi:hypothetical protein
MNDKLRSLEIPGVAHETADGRMLIVVDDLFEDRCPEYMRMLRAAVERLHGTIVSAAFDKLDLQRVFHPRLDLAEALAALELPWVQEQRRWEREERRRYRETVLILAALGRPR